MSVSLLNVLNTVTALGTDAYVDANGFLNLQGTPAFKASSISSMTITPYNAEVLQITTVTPTAVNNSLYTMAFTYRDANSGMVVSVPLNVESDSSATATEICDAFRALITSNTALDAIVTVSGTSTLIVTAKAGFPIFTLATTDSKLSIVTGTPGEASVGTGTSLIAKYPSTAGYYNAGGFASASSIVASNNYTQVLVSSVSGDSAVILVNVAATNYNDLLGAVGTLTALKAGYRAIWSAPATTTAEVTISTGAIALAGGSTTFATLGAQSGDALVIGSSAAITAITGITGAAAGFGTNTSAVSAATFKFVALRNIPL